MVENLKTTKYKDGTPLPNVTDETEWTGLSTPAYCWYNNDYKNYGVTFGALYNWYVVDPANMKKIAPEGWHLHMMIRAEEGYLLQDILRDFKKLTCKAVIKENYVESRKECLLKQYEKRYSLY